MERDTPPPIKISGNCISGVSSLFLFSLLATIRLYLRVTVTKNLSNEIYFCLHFKMFLKWDKVLALINNLLKKKRKWYSTEDMVNSSRDVYGTKATAQLMLTHQYYWLVNPILLPASVFVTQNSILHQRRFFSRKFVCETFLMRGSTVFQC